MYRLPKEDMKQPGLQEIFSTNSRIIAEFAIAERLRRMPDVELHPTLFNTPLIYGPDQARKAMTKIYSEYVTAAQQAGLPLLLAAPTWRLDSERVAGGYVPQTINFDAVEYLIGVRGKLNQKSDVLVGALVGPKNDCYRPDLAPTAKEAEKFHNPQIQELATTDAEFLQAQTLPSVAEALGISRAMAESGKPYIISFCTGIDGNVLDGTSLPEAMAFIDQQVSTAPQAYYVNCTHPDFLLTTYTQGELERLSGIQANSSSKDVALLDEASSTESDPVDQWAESMLQLHEKHKVPVLGGCCGTSLTHLEAIL